MYGIQDKINQILRGEETIRKNQSMLTAQSDSIELYHALCDMTKDLTQKTNEVARLRELLKKVFFELEKVPFQTPKLTAFTAHRLADRYREELARLAPAPEEPKTSAFSDKCIGNVTKFTHEGNNDAKDKQPEWRELLPDEVIQEGDERTDRHHELGWRKAENSIGTLAWKWTTLKFRTRRPLPEGAFQNDTFIKTRTSEKDTK